MFRGNRAVAGFLLLIVAVTFSSQNLHAASDSAKPKAANKEACIKYFKFALEPEQVVGNIDYIKSSETPALRALRNEIQNHGGFYSKNLDVIKKHDTMYSRSLYPTTTTDQGWAGNCWIHAQLNSYRQLLISQKKIGPDFEFSTAWVYYFDLLEKSNRRLAKAILAIEKDRTADVFRDKVEDQIEVVADSDVKKGLELAVKTIFAAEITNEDLSSVAKINREIAKLTDQNVRRRLKKIVGIAFEQAEASENSVYRRIRNDVEKVDDGGWKNYLPFLIEKYGLVPRHVMPDTAALKDSYQMLYDINEHLYRVINEMIHKDKETRNEKLTRQQRINNLLDIRNHGILGLQKILGTYLGNPSFEKFDVVLDYGSNFDVQVGLESRETRGRHIDSQLLRMNGVDPHELAEHIGFDSSHFVVVSAYPGLGQGLYKVKRSSVGIPQRDHDKYDSTLLNLTNQRLQELVRAGIDLGVGIEFSTNMSRGIDQETGILHPEIRMYREYFGLEEGEQGKEMSLKEESLLGYSQQEHAMTFIGYDVRDGQDKPAKKFLVKNSWGWWVGGPQEWFKNHSVQFGDFHMYREFFEQNVSEILVPRVLLSPEELKALESKPKILKKEDLVRFKNRLK